MSKKKVLSLISASLIIASPAAFSEDVSEDRLEIPSSFNPVGSGARALGLGGSFIAMADDATAASWNPSALIQLRQSEMAIVYSQTNLTEKNTFSSESTSGSENTVNNGDINYLAFSMPCSAAKCGKNMVFSVNYQRLFDLTREMDLTSSQSGEFSSLDKTYAMKQDGSLYAWGLAYAVQLTDTLSIGATLNLWEDGFADNKWTVHQREKSNVDVLGAKSSTDAIYTDEYSFSGTNINLGMLWTPYQKGETKLTIGAVYKSEFDADIEHKSQFHLKQTYTNLPENNTDTQLPETNNSGTLTMPSSFGVGVAYQWADNFTTSIDIYRTNWSNFTFAENNSDGSASAKVFPINGKTDQDVSNTTQIRVGAEYRLISQSAGANYIIPIRAGLFKDPAPSVGSSNNISGVSAGTGIALDNWVFDIAWQYRFGDEVGTSYLQDFGFSQEINEHQVFGSLFYRF